MHPLIINDPVYGFISLPRGIFSALTSHPLFQRLDRIRQLGMAPIVYPGAMHTRKQHSLGALHLTQQALRTLAGKGHFLFDSEVEATEIAILLHDIGHGPFSHVLEHELISGISHEEISRLMMQRINAELHGDLNLAIAIFDGKHPKPFLHELISSQLDMDRMDYLCRDSFYTGVREGNIGAARIVHTLDLADDHLVVDAKGIYSVENYLMARRLMYWQVYLHKTALAAEELFKSILRRARFLALNGEHLFASPALAFFLENTATKADFASPESNALSTYAALDDSDLLCAIKVWADAADPILSTLARCFCQRRLFKAVDVAQVVAETSGNATSEMPSAPFAAGCAEPGRDPQISLETLLEEARREVAAELGITIADTDYFVSTRSVSTQLYSTHADGIGILMPDGSVRDVAELSTIVRSDATSAADRKQYIIRYR